MLYSLFPKRRILGYLNFKFITLFCSIVLMGCSSQSATVSLDANQAAQFKMLVSVIAGSKTLKYQCNRSDIPDDSRLIQQVIQIGKGKGWDVAVFTKKQEGNLSKLELTSTNVYRKLSQELAENPDDLPQKCDELSELLNNFIEQSNFS